MSQGMDSAAMEFASDNTVGASAPILEAILEAGRAGPAAAYGADPWTETAVRRLREVFEADCEVVLVPTGTVANALALACVTPPWGGVLCHAFGHIIDEEAGAPELITGGAKLVGLPGRDGKLDPATLSAALARFPAGVPRQVQASCLSLSQATESGTVYACQEIEALAAVAHRAGLAVHVDGARFANAVAGLGASPAAMTWKAGVDILSLGATKNGAMACEAVVIFDRARAGPAAILRKRAGATLSKGRLLGAQMAAWLADDHWLALARHANAMAAALADGLAALPGVRLPWRVEANEVFPILPRAMHDRLVAAGAHYYSWDVETLTPEARPGEAEVFARFVCSFETTTDSVARLLALAGSPVR